MKGKFIDLVGKRFGRLIVLCRVPNHNGQTCWLCKCDCGNEKKVRSNSLMSKQVVSCGCYAREKKSERVKIEYGLSAKRQTFNAYKQKAKRRNILFNLYFDDFINLTQQNCWYCGIELSNVHKGNGNGGFKYNGIDRVDNKKGYTLGNVVPCCGQCNKAKRDLSYKDFFNWSKRLSANLKQLGEGYDSTWANKLSEKLPMEA